MLTLNVLAPVLYCGALVMMLNVCSDDVLASTFLSLSTTSALEVVVLLCSCCTTRRWAWP